MSPHLPATAPLSPTSLTPRGSGVPPREEPPSHCKVCELPFEPGTHSIDASLHTSSCEVYRHCVMALNLTPTSSILRRVEAVRYGHSDDGVICFVPQSTPRSRRPQPHSSHTPRSHNSSHLSPLSNLPPPEVGRGSRGRRPRRHQSHSDTPADSLRLPDAPCSPHSSQSSDSPRAPRTTVGREFDAPESEVDANSDPTHPHSLPWVLPNTAQPPHVTSTSLGSHLYRRRRSSLTEGGRTVPNEGLGLPSPQRSNTGDPHSTSTPHRHSEAGSSSPYHSSPSPSPLNRSLLASMRMIVVGLTPRRQRQGSEGREAQASGGGGHGERGERDGGERGE
eukprot:GHVN01075351.1.p1 GENE.GHVN01075351.1~~GHVN01075351.1.p1  ORF type:complete len:346 (-),score=122.53 GHVN01075351.1:17-1021(-)